MLNYFYALLEKHKADNNLVIATQQAHKSFCLQNRKTLLFVDFLFITMFLANFMAVGITNYLSGQNVPKTELYTITGVPVVVKNIQVYEVNPVQQVINDYDVHPQTRQLFTSFLKQALIWSLIIMGYVYSRRKMLSSEQLTSLFAYVLSGWLLLNWDFLNDLGYLLGYLL